MALKVSCYVSIVNSFLLKIILILGPNKSDQKHIILLPHCAAAVCCRQKNCYCSKIHGIEKGRIYQHFFALSVTFIMPLHITVHTMYFQILYVYHYIVVYCLAVVYIYARKKANTWYIYLGFNGHAASTKYFILVQTHTVCSMQILLWFIFTIPKYLTISLFQ